MPRAKNAAPAVDCGTALITLADLAYMLCITEQSVASLANNGKILRNGPGRYWLRESIHNCVLELRERLMGRNGDNNFDPRMMAARAKAEILQIELAELRGAVVRVDIVESAWGEILSQLRVALLGLPTKLGPVAQSARTAREATHLLRAGVEEILTDASREPKYTAYAKRHEGRRTDELGPAGVRRVNGAS